LELEAQGDHEQAQKLLLGVSKNWNFYYQLAKLPYDKQVQALKDMPKAHKIELEKAWKWISRPEQIPPEDFYVWVFRGGRGSGKTYSASNWIANEALMIPGDYAVVGQVMLNVRGTMMFGRESGLMRALLAMDPACISSNSKRECNIHLKNGSKILGFGSCNPEALRGYNWSGIWFDELAFYNNASDTYYDTIPSVRVGRSRILITTSPSKLNKALLREIEAGEGTVTATSVSYKNLANLTESQLVTWKNFEGTSRYNEEVLGEFDNSDGSLFRSEDFRRLAPVDINAVDYHSNAKLEFDRIVVAIDPNNSNTDLSGESGIIVVGKRRLRNELTGIEEPTAHILADYSMKGSRNETILTAIQAYKNWGADEIVIEVNSGGDWLKEAFQKTDASVNVKTVCASSRKGKGARAEPVAVCYQQHKVYHRGYFAKLEQQMLDFVDTPRMAKGLSPDRMDALVWGVQTLILDNQRTGFARGLTSQDLPLWY